MGLSERGSCVCYAHGELCMSMFGKHCLCLGVGVVRAMQPACVMGCVVRCL